MHSTTRIILFLSLILLVSSCKTSEKVLYLQDVKVDTPEKIENSQVIKIEPKDMLSIVVSSSDPAVAKIFNLPVSATQEPTVPDMAITCSDMWLTTKVISTSLSSAKSKLRA